MTHFWCVAFVEPNIAQHGNQAIAEELVHLMAPYDVNLNAESSRYNPAAQWDVWEIGGRYDGLLTGTRVIVDEQDPLLEFEPEALDGSCQMLSSPPSERAPGTVLVTFVGFGKDKQYLEVPTSLFPPDPVVDPMWEARLQRNSSPVRDLCNTYSPFAVVTPDGIWHAQAEEPIPGESPDDNQQWRQAYRQLRALYSNCVAVGLDCHI